MGLNIRHKLFPSLLRYSAWTRCRHQAGNNIIRGHDISEQTRHGVQCIVVILIAVGGVRYASEQLRSGSRIFARMHPEASKLYNQLIGSSW